MSLENNPIKDEPRPSLFDRFMRPKGIGPNRGSEQTTTNRAPEGGQHNMETAEEPTLLDHAAREPMTRSGFRGPRGRHVEGYPGITEAIAPGLPPVLAPWKPQDLIPKDVRIPKIPHQFSRYVDVQVTVATGRVLDRDAGHPINTLQISNYSKQWLYVASAGFYVMPYCVGVQIPIPGASSKMEIDSAAPPGITQPSLAASAQVFLAVAMEWEGEFSPGLSVLNAGTLP